MHFRIKEFDGNAHFLPQFRELRTSLYQWNCELVADRKMHTEHTYCTSTVT